jgi:large subunit ribosomal protein L25
METIELKTEIRKKVGGREPRRLRKTGFIPGVVYGGGMSPLSIQVDRVALQRALHTSAGENAVITLKFDDASSKDLTVIVKAGQHHIINDMMTHVDFQAISLTEKIKVHVHIHVKGEAVGVQQGGMLDVVHHEVEVECLPTQIPDKISVNVSDLGFNDAIHIKELVFPAGVVCLNDPDDVVVVVHPPHVETEGAADALEGAAASEPEVIKKGKEDKEE